MPFHFLIKVTRRILVRLSICFICCWVHSSLFFSHCCRHRDHGLKVELHRVGFWSVQRLVVVLQIRPHVFRSRVCGGGCKDSCNSVFFFVVGFNSLQQGLDKQECIGAGAECRRSEERSQFSMATSPHTNDPCRQRRISYTNDWVSSLPAHTVHACKPTTV
jgi:hypothetical protein